MATHNEGVISAGKLYRSGRLDRNELQSFIRREGIKSVINLTGPGTGASWYSNELQVCHDLGVRHVDIHWGAKSLPPPGEVSALLGAYRTLPRPILIHCRSGSDRTGLAGSIYLIDQEKMSWQEASHALTVSYGHFAIYPYFEMDEFLELYGESKDKSLRDWVAQDYPSIYVAEGRESKSHEVLEPLEYFFKDHF